MPAAAKPTPGPSLPPVDPSKGVKPKGAAPGTRVVQGSKVNPARFPNAGGRNRKVDVTVWSGPMRKRTFTTTPANARKAVERFAANQVRAKVHDAMSGDLVGESFKVTRIGRPDRWTSYCTV